MSKTVGSGLLRAMLDAIHGADERIGGQAVTRLRVALEDDATEILVESTVGFGEYTDGEGNGRLVVGGEVIDYDARTGDTFTGLTRGVQSTPIGARYPANTVVYDLAENTTAIDLVRRAFLVNFAIGADLDQVGRNLGLNRCPGVIDEIWRRVIKNVAYLAKQPPSAIITAMDALVGPSGYNFFERTVSQPNRFFVTVDVDLAEDLQGRFFLNSGERHTIGPGGVVTLDYPIATPEFIGSQARSSIRPVSGWAINDGENFILNDGVNPPVTFEFDDNASVVETPVLRQVAFTATTTEEQMRDAIIAAINGAPALDINASPGTFAPWLELQNTNVGDIGNQPITNTVSDTFFEVEIDFMFGGWDADPALSDRGVFVWPLVAFFSYPFNAIPNGWREIPLFGRLDLQGGSITGPNEITTAFPPGIEVIVDYHATPAHYLAPDETFRNDGTDFPPYFADNLLAADCLLDQVRAAGVGVELSVSL